MCSSEYSIFFFSILFDRNAKNAKYRVTACRRVQVETSTDAQRQNNIERGGNYAYNINYYRRDRGGARILTLWNYESRRVWLKVAKIFFPPVSTWK